MVGECTLGCIGAPGKVADSRSVVLLVVLGLVRSSIFLMGECNFKLWVGGWVFVGLSFTRFSLNEMTHLSCVL